MKHRIVDVHNHPSWHGHTMDRLVKNMDKHGIERTWLLSCETTPDELNAAPIYHGIMDPRGLSQPLWMVVEGLRRFPDRFIGGWAPDPRDRHSRARLKAAVDLHGIRVCGELKFRMRYDNQDAIAMCRFCGELGLPALFHLEAPAFRLRQECRGPQEWPEWYGGDLSVIDNMCRLCPDTVFIGHGPGFWREIGPNAERSAAVYPRGRVKPGGQAPMLMRKHGNLYADLSAASGWNSLARDFTHARRFVSEFQDRLLFGRDGFDGRLIELLEKLDISDAVMAKVLCGNAERLVPMALAETSPDISRARESVEISASARAPL
ncbi:MAG: amidohydrolase family protein [Verrucomicrobiota bacterium]|nr:amidohydrolase family protein [Verrucomicrobiota bacterium]